MDKRWLSRRAGEAGWGRIVHIGEPEGALAGYAMKANYASTKRSMSYDDRLAVHGGTKIWHWSRDYMKPWAAREWVPKHAPARDPGPWILLPARDYPLSAEEARQQAVDDEARAARAWEGSQEPYRDAIASMEGIRLAKAQLVAVDVADIGTRPVRNVPRRPPAWI